MIAWLGKESDESFLCNHIKSSQSNPESAGTTRRAKFLQLIFSYTLVDEILLNLNIDKVNLSLVFILWYQPIEFQLSCQVAQKI